MNWLIMIGIIVIGFGTYFIYLGTDLNNKKSQQDLVKKIEHTQSIIEDLKTIPNDDSLVTKIADVEKEFHNWADEFIKNKESKKLFVEKKKVSSLEERIEVSNEWLPGYKAFFDVIKKSIEAYNSKTNSEIVYDIPIIPDNIFINSDHNYSAFIVFRENIIWEFIISPPKEFDINYFPDVSLDIYNKNVLNKEWIVKQSSLTDKLSILSYSDEKLGIHAIKNTRLNLAYLKTGYVITNSKETLIEIARDLIEAQLLQM